MRQYVLYWWFFFFSSRRRHTRFDCDWSSDVCSSDLQAVGRLRARQLVGRQLGVELARHVVAHLSGTAAQHGGAALELEARGPLDGRHHLEDDLLELPLAAYFLGPLFASPAAERRAHPPGRELEPPHSRHPIPFPADA